VPYSSPRSSFMTYASEMIELVILVCKYSGNEAKIRAVRTGVQRSNWSFLLSCHLWPWRVHQGHRCRWTLSKSRRNGTVRTLSEKAWDGDWHCQQVLYSLYSSRHWKRGTCPPMEMFWSVFVHCKMLSERIIFALFSQPRFAPRPHPAPSLDLASQTRNLPTPGKNPAGARRCLVTLFWGTAYKLPYLFNYRVMPIRERMTATGRIVFSLLDCMIT